MSEDNKDTLVLNVRNRPGNQGFVEIVKEVIEAAKQGYTVDESAVGIYTGPLIHGSWRIALVKDKEAVEEKTEETPEESLHVLEDPKATKPDLLAFAKEIDVEVPADKKSPAAIKKFIKEQLEDKSSEDNSSEEK